MGKARGWRPGGLGVPLAQKPMLEVGAHAPARVAARQPCSGQLLACVELGAIDERVLVVSSVAGTMQDGLGGGGQAGLGEDSPRDWEREECGSERAGD